MNFLSVAFLLSSMNALLLCHSLAGVIVTAGVTVGKSNVICANSVVTKNTPDYAIIAGTPGRVVGTIDPTTGSYNWLKNS
jgi:acetyltransferase-like isoleucine patch superfamily enzyme